MKHKSTLFPRLGALILIFALLLTPAQALTVEQARELVEKYYVDPVPQSVLDRPTIEAMLEALGDPYTEYMTAQEYADFLSSMSDELQGGIGVTAHMTEEGLVISEVAEGSPAQAAGIRSGDCIVEVDGVNIVGMDADAAVALIRGAEGTKVSVTYLRQGRRRAATLTRSTIVIPATTGSLLEGGVGYIVCETWGADTLGHFRDVIRELDDDVGCWLIDLRGNGGGLTDAATDVAGLFCGAGTMAYLRMRDDDPSGYAYDFYGSWDDALTQKPAVILVDGATASSSEVFTAAMRDCARAVVVGERTFGKGVAQGLWDQDALPDCFPDGDCLKITIARVYSLLGNTNDVIGVIPQIPTTPDETEGVGYALAQIMAEAGEEWADEVDALLTQIVEESCAFPDLDDEPYAQSIAALSTYGIVQGDENGLFDPQGTLTRSQLAQILQNVMAYPWETVSTFGDVDKEAWYASAAAAVADMGLMTGTGEDSFSPDRTLTHQELFTVIARLGRRLNDDLDLAVRAMDREALELRILRDYDSWAKDSVWLLSTALESSRGRSLNLLWDEPEYIDPTAPATRAETAELLYTLLYYLGILP